MPEETSFLRLKRALLGELFQDYPEGAVYGKVEYFLKSRGYAVDVLVRHGILERLSQEDKNKLVTNLEERKKDWYRLTSKGVDLTISMINLDHSERIMEYAKETRTFNVWIRGLTIGLFIIGITQLVLMYLQNPIS
ncbi:MAG: hypothetical protein AABX26_03380 [Nanoarchaeota archaeon]